MASSSSGVPPTSIIPATREVKIELSHRLPVGKEGGPAPVINDLDWNCVPSNCKGKGAIAMLACVSSFGTDIFYLPKSTRKWTKMAIKKRPSREGQSVQWHKQGKFLATTSDPKESKHGSLSILSYDSNFMCFNAAKVYECPEGSRITSLRWVGQKRMVVALFPSSQILHFQFSKATGTVSLLGSSRCIGFPLDTSIYLESHPLGNFIFSCAPDADQILVWGKQTDMEEQDNFGLSIKCAIPVEKGQCGMEFNKRMDGLFTFQKGIWRFWTFHTALSDEMLKCVFTSVDEHRVVKGKDMKYRSHLIWFSASKIRYFAASIGDGDTMIFHQKVKEKLDWRIKGYRNKEVCYRPAKCLKFNPKEDLSMRVAMGGNSGYIHIWAIYRHTSSRMNVSVPERTDEQSFYRYYLDPKEAGLPSTSSGDEKEVWDEVVEADDDNDNDDDDDDEEEDRGGNLQGVVHGIAGLTIQGRSGDDQGQKKLSERFDEITNEAQRISDCIEAKGTVSSDDMKALCQKILCCRDEIAQAIKKEDA